MKNKFLIILFTLLFAANSALALSDADYKKLMQDQNFAEADKRLGTVWKEINSILEGQAKQDLLSNQKQWISTKRDAYAKDIIDMGIHKELAYSTVTKDRVKMLENYLQQVKKPNTFIELTGEIITLHSDDGNRFLGYTLVLLNGAKSYYASPTYTLFNPELEEQLSGYAEEPQLVKISGKLSSINSFDPATIKIIP